MPTIPRRTLLRATLASTAAFAAGVRAQPSSAIRGQQGKTATLKVGSSQATHEENAHGVFFDKFVTELAAKTGGEIGAVFYGDSQLGPEDKYTTQINFGTLDMMLTGSDWTPIVPELGVMTLGFLFSSMEQQGAVMDGSAGRQLEDIFKHKTKAEILGWGFNFGGRNVLSKKVVATPADLKGLKLRVLPSPTFVQTFRLLGAAPVPMSFGEIYTSLQTGVVDGLEHDPPTILQFKFFEVAKNLALTEHIYDPVTPIVSTLALGRLSATQQQAVRDAAATAIKGQRGRATSAAAAALETLKQSGVQVHTIDRAALAAAVKPLWTSFTDQHPDTKPVVEAILKA
ncbi:TRAP transporter substrate-binding protein [Acidisphaera sp. L21]|uniref:TRAP transporter substrate-binding protein n=1 Tax=Acidisphaera sp. L21 TaxID=1641851 RepID=UPI00131B9A86|nr:TRAP transporter substrate-binding protein [Acidisphaera sp. L21]